MRLRGYRGSEVFLLVDRMNRATDRRKVAHNPADGIIRRPAGDNWF